MVAPRRPLRARKPRRARGSGCVVATNTPTGSLGCGFALSAPSPVMAGRPTRLAQQILEGTPMPRDLCPLELPPSLCEIHTFGGVR